MSRDADDRGHVDPVTVVSLTQMMIVDMPTQTMACDRPEQLNELALNFEVGFRMRVAEEFVLSLKLVPSHYELQYLLVGRQIY